ncbi:MAG: FtsB family cell division protein [Rhodoglobus sp.]
MARRPFSRTDGTRQVPVTLDREESAPEHWLRTIRLSGFTVLMLMLIILAVIVLAPNLRIFIEQRQQIAQLEAQVEEAQGSVDELTRDVARWSDPAYIEAQARERLFYVFPGDVSYLVVGDAAASVTENGQPISDQIQTTRVDWLKTLLSSVYTAGLTDAPAAELVGPDLEGAQ